MVVTETSKCVHIISVTRVHFPGVMCVSNCLIISTQTASMISDESAEYGLTEKVQCVFNECHIMQHSDMQLCSI